MKQYCDLIKRTLDEGVWVENKRTGTKCLTVINADLKYGVGNGEFPLITTRKLNYRGAIAEIIGYLRGYTNIRQFHQLGTKTWDANANNPAWLNSIYHTGEEGDLGIIYGAAGNELPHIEYSRVDPTSKRLCIYSGGNIKWLASIIDKLKKGEDDRGLIWNFWNPSIHHLGCLRPCMYSHHFSLVNDTLYLNSTQRSADLLLGVGYNMVQCYVLLWIMAKLTGKKPGVAYHKLVNVHIYENQLSALLEHKQHEREPYPLPGIICNKPITYETVFGLCENVEDNLHPDDFVVVNYRHHPAIKYPFTV